MLNEQIIKDIFASGEANEVSAQELYYQSSKEINISVFQGEIDKYSISEDGGLSYRAIKDGKMGYTYTERLDSIDGGSIVNEALENAKIIESDDEMFIYGGSKAYASLDLFNAEATSRPMADKIAFMLSLEEALLARDPRVKRLAGNSLNEGISEKIIVNSEGLKLAEKSNYCLVYISVVVEADGDIRTGLGYDVADDFEKISKDKIIEMALSEALSMLGAKPMKSKTCPVVMKNTTFAQLMSAFNGLYSAERVHKGLSKFKNKLQKQVASEHVNIYDDPHLEKGLETTAFDAEGVATYKKSLVHNGVLETYLYDLKTANKDGVAPTGNASKGSYKGTIGIAPSNVYLGAGNHTFDDIIQSVEDGVYIVNVTGLHAGLNTISGDFSLECYGYVIRAGKIAEPTTQITVSGNYFELLMAIEMLGDDVTFTILGSGYVGAPTVKVKALSISGV